MSVKNSKRRIYKFSIHQIPEDLRIQFRDECWKHNRRLTRIISGFSIVVGVLFLFRRLILLDIPEGDIYNRLYQLNYFILIGLSIIFLSVTFSINQKDYTFFSKFLQRAYIIGIVLNYCFLSFIDYQIADDSAAVFGLIICLSVVFWMDSISYLILLAVIDVLVSLGFFMSYHPMAAVSTFCFELLIFTFIGIVLFYVINESRTKSFLNEKLLGKSVERLEFMSRRDFLTELFNRRLMIEDIEAQYAISRRMDYQFTIILMDLDHFKRVNDGLGHAVGDIVLKEAAAILTSEVRESDRVYRYGGEEFLILLPETSMEKAIILAERLLNDFREYSFTGVPWKVTMSMGISGNHERVLSEDLVKLADVRLYAAKNNGRDQYIAEGYSEPSMDGEIPTVLEE